MNHWLKYLPRAVFSTTCAVCGAHGDGAHDLCTACRAELPWLGAACKSCALPLSGGECCGVCLQHPPPHTTAQALFRYADPIAPLLQDLKFNGKLHLARLFGALLAERLADVGADRPALILPVPLHPKRLATRGFNQALELARPVARRFGVPLEFTGCARQRDTATQSTLPADQRRRNVKGAFTVTRVAPHVAIVDDVMTTGHTVRAFAQALRQAGAERVDVWVIARAARQR